MSTETVRKWMSDAGLWLARKERRRVQQPRLRRSRLGELRPVAFYSDKATVFRVNRKDHGGSGITQFGRAMSELNIDVICANTPAAKGRVKRAHLTLQDRSVGVAVQRATTESRNSSAGSSRMRVGLRSYQKKL